MLKLTEYIPNQELLVQHLNNGVVETRRHNTLPLTIWCYSKKATYDSIWDEVTCKTRGLITHAHTGEIVARPFEKFFNINTSFLPETSFASLAKEPYPPFIQDKLDGSMGTYWSYQGQYGIATKGSFHSEQAEWATKFLHEHYRTHGTHYWMAPWTPVFEIICQSVQHHVCHYEPQEDNRLVLIGMCNRRSGEEIMGKFLEHQGKINGLPVAEVAYTTANCKFLEHQGKINGLPVAEVAYTTANWGGEYNNLSILKGVQQHSRPNREGWVMSWTRNGKPALKVKVKHEEFLRLQKIAHYTTPKVVFEYCRLGNWAEINEVVRLSSAWLSSQVKEWVTNYQREYDRINEAARYVVSMALISCTTRKEYAAYFHQEHVKTLASVCFNILDEKDYKKSVWDLVEPMVKLQKFSEVEAEG
jgi:hypothetical protein